MAKHTVTQGECLASIAEHYGYFWQTLWNDPANKPLWDKGRLPDRLVPGDVLNIPDKKTKDFVRPTGQRHTWKVKGIPAKLRLQLFWEDEPRKDEAFTLDIEGQIIEGSTDGDGRIEITVPPHAQRGVLRIGDGEREAEYELALGHLDPVEEISGAQAMLQNLGYECQVTGYPDDATRRAVEAFQARCKLPATGEIDDATRSKLRAAHDTE